MKKLTNNIGLKVLALFFAIGLWMVVMNVDDPEVTSSFVVPVTLENEEELTEAGKVYEVLDDSDSVRVTVTAKRSIISNLSSSDFQAVADIRDLTDDEMEGECQLQIYVSALRYTNQISISSRTKYLTISIENEESVEIALKTASTGTPAEGYLVVDMETDPETITVTGPASVVEAITAATVTVDVTDMSRNLTASAEPVFYNEQGDEVDVSRCQLEDDSVTVYVTCYSYKTVPIEFSTSGTPYEGYEVSDITADYNEVTIMGTSDDIASITKITVPDTDISVEGAYEDVVKLISISDYLPTGVYVYEESEDVITVTVTIIPYETKTLTFSTSGIKVNGLGSDYTSSFSDSTVSLTIMGAAADIEEVTASDVTVTVDLTDYEAGTHSVLLEATLPTGISLSSDVYETVTITKKSTSSSSTTSATDTTEDETDTDEDTE